MIAEEIEDATDDDFDDDGNDGDVADDGEGNVVVVVAFGINSKVMVWSCVVTVFLMRSKWI